MKWLRLYHDTITDPKWRVVAAESGQSEAIVLAVWVHMLVNASASKVRGTLEGWNDRFVGAAMGLRGDVVAAVREAMQGVTLDGDRLTGWDKRQKASDNVAERVKRHRNNKSESPAPGGGSGNGAVPHGNGTNGVGNGDVTLHSPGETEKHLSLTLTNTPVSCEREEEGGGGGAGARTCEEIRQVVAGKAGMEARRVTVGKVEAWLGKGYDPDLDIYPAVQEVADTVRGPIVSPNCFDAAIDRHHAARTAPKQEASNVHQFRSPAQQHRGNPGCATGGLAALRCLARELETGD